MAFAGAHVPLKEEDVFEVEPRAGFCTKFRDSHNGFGKIFFNFCLCDELPPPAQDLNEAELAKVLDSEDAASFRVPLSVGELHMECDKSGGSCAAYDIIINGSFYEKRVSSSELFKTFLVLVAADAVEAKHHLKLDRQSFVLLQNRKAVGQLLPQRIRKQPLRPLIEEVELEPNQKPKKSKRSKGKGSAKAESTVEGPPKVPGVEKKDSLEKVEAKRILVEEVGEVPRETEPAVKMVVTKNSEGRPQLKIDVSLPGVRSASGIDLEMNEDRLRLKVPAQFKTDFHVPVLIATDSIESYFDKDSSSLCVTALCQ